MDKVNACGFLYRDRNLFIARRSEKESFMPGLWELVGGGVENGESLEKALVREFKEELDLDIIVVKQYYSWKYMSEENGKKMEEKRLLKNQLLLHFLHNIKLSCSCRMFELSDCFGFDLANAFACDLEFFTDFFKGFGLAVFKPKTHHKNFSFSWRKRFKHFVQRVFQKFL